MNITKTWILLVALALGNTPTHARDRLTELEQKLQTLQAEIEGIKQAQTTTKTTPKPITAVDLSSHELSSLDEPANGHVLARPWWRNVDVSGFGAAGFYDTGSAGTRRHGGFEVKESTLFINADVWENASLFVEVQANRLGKDDQLFVRTGEVYVHFRTDQLGFADNVGLKVGRVDIPFGEEYLTQDSIDNPLITTSASYIYGWDEGILAHGTIGKLDAIVAITDGTDARSSEDHDDKALNLKLTYRPVSDLMLSASFMRNGKAKKSALEFGGSHFEPVGASHQSASGASANEFVDSLMYQIDSHYNFHLGSVSGYLKLFAGAAKVEDRNSLFDRDLRWFTLQPLVNLTSQLYLVLRYSEIGTFDSNEGYHFDGKTFAGGNGAFGYDTKRFRRLGVGLGWVPHPRMVAKFELGKDWFDLIDASQLETDNGDRTFTAFEVAVRF